VSECENDFSLKMGSVKSKGLVLASRVALERLTSMKQRKLARRITYDWDDDQRLPAVFSVFLPISCREFDFSTAYSMAFWAEC